MVQARGLGIDGTLLREFGVAGLMHDIGKVQDAARRSSTSRTKLDDDEIVVMRRHPVDGAEILRKTRDLTPLAAVVAFEHHLRLDGSGYPAGVIASVAQPRHDAVRDRGRLRRDAVEAHYQEAFPAERILAVLKRGEGQEFEQNLVRRFVQLMGLYPVGSLVRLNTGACAVVLRPCAADPHRPRVRVVFEADGHRLDAPYDINLWEVEPAPAPLVVGHRTRRTRPTRHSTRSSVM